MVEKLSIAGVFTFFLLVAAGVAISSNDTAMQLTYAGTGFDGVIAHIFYGLNFAVMVILLSIAGFLVVGFILVVAVLAIVLALDRAIKPINAID